VHLTRVTLHADRYPTDEHYPFKLPVLRETRTLEFTTPVTFFVGENGAGKSTLLEAMARRSGIYIWEGIPRSRYEVNPYESLLPRYIDVEWVDGAVPGSFFSSEIFQNFARVLDEMATADPGQLRYFGGRSLVSQSHGQALLAFFRSRYRVRGVYFLDEPETALSPRSLLGLVKLLAELAAGGEAQFIIASHSPILLALPGATIYSFDHVPVRPVAYADTDYYRVYRDFMEDPARYVGEP
jgi:predicted ATPase